MQTISTFKLLFWDAVIGGSLTISLGSKTATAYKLLLQIYVKDSPQANEGVVDSCEDLRPLLGLFTDVCDFWSYGITLRALCLKIFFRNLLAITFSFSRSGLRRLLT